MSHQNLANQEEEEEERWFPQHSGRTAADKKTKNGLQSCWTVGEEESTSSIHRELLVFPWKHLQRQSFRCVCLYLVGLAARQCK